MMMITFNMTEHSARSLSEVCCLMKHQSKILFAGWKTGSTDALVFVPALFLVLLGVSVLLAPKLVAGLLAGLLLFLGIVLAVVGYRLLRFKRNIESVVKSVQAEVRVSPIFTEILKEQELTKEDTTKIIIH
jgi:uncharacterized membrane protein